MDYVMVYWSRYGHNKQIVDYLKEILEKKGHSATTLKTSDTDPLSLPDADVYVFSAAVEAFRIQKQMRNFLKKIDKMDGKKCAIINTHAMKKRNWLKSMEKMISKKNMQKIAEIDFNIGEGQEKGEGLDNKWTEKLDEFIEAIQK